MLLIKIEVKRPKGSPRSSWTDQIRKDIEIKRGKWEELQEKMKRENDW